MLLFGIAMAFAFLSGGGCAEKPVDSEPSPAAPAAEAPTPSPVEPAEDLAFARESTRPGAHLAVLVTANGMGELEDCGCNLRPLGGLARRVEWILSHASLWTSRLVLDAGDLLAEESTLAEPRRATVLDRADVIVRAHTTAGYDAHALGDRDLALGLDALRRLTGPGRPALLCANLVSAGDESLLFQASSLFQREGIKVGVIGVLGTHFPRRAELETRLSVQITDPVAAVQREAEALRAKGAQILIVLAHAKPDTMEAIADEVSGLTAVFGSQTPRETNHPVPLGNTYLADGHEKGKHIGLLGLHIAPDTLSPVFHDPVGRAVLQGRQKEIQKRLTDRTKAIQRAEEAGRTGNLDWLKKNLVKLKTELQEIRLSLNEMTDAPANASVISWDLIALDKTLPEHEQVRDSVVQLLTRQPSLVKKKKPADPPANP